MVQRTFPSRVGEKKPAKDPTFKGCESCYHDLHPRVFGDIQSYVTFFLEKITWWLAMCDKTVEQEFGIGITFEKKTVEPRLFTMHDPQGM